MANIDPLIVSKILLLVAVANSAPVAAKKLLGNKLACPVDGALVLPDGQRLFGRSKTIRGIVASIVATALCSSLIGLSFFVGACLGIMAMAGDLLSSFMKRRMKIAPSGMALGLDQLPEALLPAYASRWLLWPPVTFTEIVIIGILFFVCELIASRIFFALKLRDQPY
jgi:CDP-diglyceride synthetase